MDAVNRWLNWQPETSEFICPSPKMEVSKVAKSSFDTFATSVTREEKIIHHKESTLRACPYHLPEGISLVRYTPKDPPLAVNSLVVDIPQFIQHGLAELAVRLRDPVQIKAGDSVFNLLSKLADCGLELRLECRPSGSSIRKRISGEPPR